MLRKTLPRSKTTNSKRARKSPPAVIKALGLICDDRFTKLLKRSVALVREVRKLAKTMSANVPKVVIRFAKPKRRA